MAEVSDTVHSTKRAVRHPARALHRPEASSSQHQEAGRNRVLRRRRGGRACAGRSPTSCRYCALPSEMVYLRPTPLRHKGGGNKDDAAHQCEARVALWGSEHTAKLAIAKFRRFLWHVDGRAEVNPAGGGSGPARVVSPCLARVLFERTQPNSSLLITHTRNHSEPVEGTRNRAHSHPRHSDLPCRLAPKPLGGFGRIHDRTSCSHGTRHKTPDLLSALRP